MFVQKEQLGFLQCGHQQGDCLTLTAGEQTNLCGKPVFQSQIQNFQKLFVLFPFLCGNAGTQTSALASTGGKGKVFFDLHIGRCAGHGVLKYPSQIFGTLMLPQVGDIHTVDDNTAAIHRINTGNHIQHSGFTCTVTANDRDKIALVQVEINAVQGSFFIHRTGVEGFFYINNIKHCSSPCWIF